MKQVNWFERTFDFSSMQNTFPSIIERLDGTALRISHKLIHINSAHLTAKPEGQWSIQEHVGHLIDLEPLWSGRLEDILSSKEEMRPADLENKKTDQANHNDKNLQELLDEFTEIRSRIVDRLKELTAEEIFKYSLHPRLKTRMRVIDLFLFVAAHDDHHLASMTALISKLD
jgi:uncharacterized damage-inducible protein DinB